MNRPSSFGWLSDIQAHPLKPCLRPSGCEGPARARITQGALGIKRRRWWRTPRSSLLMDAGSRVTPAAFSVWQDGSDGYDNFYDMAETDDGLIVVAGCTSGTFAKTHQGGTDLALVELFSDGSTYRIWQVLMRISCRGGGGTGVST